MKEEYKKVYDMVTLIPFGRVLTYGKIASLVGLKNPRTVGYILHNNPDPENIPCYRVVNCKGLLANSFAFGGASAQSEKLEQEGIIVLKNRIDLEKYIWNI